MPRIPRNPGSGKPPFNGPAQGGGSGQWGGPAQPAAPFTPAMARLLTARRDNPEAQAMKDVVRARMLGVLLEVAEGSESDNARVAAADKVLDRVDGKAIAFTEVSGRDGGPLEITRVIIDARDDEP